MVKMNEVDRRHHPGAPSILVTVTGPSVDLFLISRRSTVYLNLTLPRLEVKKSVSDGPVTGTTSIPMHDNANRQACRISRKRNCLTVDPLSQWPLKMWQ